MAGQDDSLKAAPGLGKRVKLVRELGGFSQAAFGKLFGVGEGSIQAWEHSTKSTLPRKRVTEFRDRFGVDPNWLWLAEGREPRWVFRPEQWSHLDRIEARINQIADHFGLPAIPGGEVGRAELEKAGESLLRDPSPARKARPERRPRRAS